MQEELDLLDALNEAITREQLSRSDCTVRDDEDDWTAEDVRAVY